MVYKQGSQYFISPARIMDWGFIKVHLRDLILTPSAWKKNEKAPWAVFSHRVFPLFRFAVLIQERGYTYYRTPEADVTPSGHTTVKIKPSPYWQESARFQWLAGIRLAGANCWRVAAVLPDARSVVVLHTVPTWVTFGKSRTHTTVQVSLTISTITLPGARANVNTYPFGDDDVIFCR